MFLFTFIHAILSSVYLDEKEYFVETNYEEFFDDSVSFDFLLALIMAIGYVNTVIEILAIVTNNKYTCKYRFRDTLLVIRGFLMWGSIITAITYMVLEDFGQLYKDDGNASWLIISWLIISLLSNFWSMGTCFFLVSDQDEIEETTLFGHS